MVLENALFGDSSAPPSDYDAYDSNGTNNAGAVYSFSEPLPANLPRSPFVKEKTLQAMIINRQREVQALVKRPITKDEAEYSAHWAAKFLQIRSFAFPTGAIAGLYRAYDTRDKFRFPFYQPKKFETAKPEFFPHQRLPLLQGVLAQNAWHLLRGSMYAWTGIILAQFFYTPYGLLVCTTGMARDPRGKDLQDLARKEVERARGQRPGVQKRPQDMNQGVQTVPQEMDQGTAPVVPQMDRNDEQSPALPDVYYGTPSVDEYEAQPTGAKSTPTSGGSAWDRVRQQAATGGGAPRKSGWVKPEAAKPKDADEFAYSKYEAETESAKDRAQREFDQRVEQERRGGDFSSGSGSSKRW